jgi:hypothetical protein
MPMVTRSTVRHRLDEWQLEMKVLLFGDQRCQQTSYVEHVTISPQYLQMVYGIDDKFAANRF